MTGKFKSPLDIANRALQHCGVTRIRSAGWPPTEDSKQASETSFVYDNVREAELRRNVWRFATRRAVLRPVTAATMLINPPVWDSTVTYSTGSIVADAENQLWASNSSVNRGNAPGIVPATGPDTSRYWSEYFGPLAVNPFVPPPSSAPGTLPASVDIAAYEPGELVYTTASNGVFQVFVSIVGGNGDTPSVPDAYDATIAYNAQSVVLYNSTLYQSNFDANLNNEPDLSPANWVIGTTYAANALVGGSDENIYQSIAGGNVGHDPTTDAGVHWTATGNLQPWTKTITTGTGSSKWRQLVGTALQSIDIVYPIGAGPDTQTETRNVFLLPNGYLRKAPMGNTGPTALGGPSGRGYDDWQFEGAFILAWEAFPIVLRFVADVTDVPTMDAMFCEGLACRVALEVVETLTQSVTKLNSIGGAYNRFMGEARDVNGIEMGAVDPPDDDYITVRY